MLRNFLCHLNEAIVQKSGVAHMDSKGIEGIPGNGLYIFQCGGIAQVDIVNSGMVKGFDERCYFLNDFFRILLTGMDQLLDFNT